MWYFAIYVQIEYQYLYRYSRDNSSTARSTDFIKKSRPGVEGYDLPPLTQKLKDTVVPTQIKSVSSRNFDTHVTKLDNGLRVASEKLFGEFCTVGGITRTLKKKKILYLK